MIYALVYDLVYVLVCLLMMFLYVHMYMDVNAAMSYVINLHYVVWVLCHYAYVVRLLCYHDVMMSCGLALSRMIIVNIVMSCVIKLHYAVCYHVELMFCFEKTFHYLDWYLDPNSKILHIASM